MTIAHRTVKLLDGKLIPALGWGNASSGLLGGGQKSIDAAKLAIASGITHIDTAQLYRTETETGVAVRESGAEGKVWVTTKLSEKEGIADANGVNRDALRKSVEGSLQRLGAKPDLLLIHNIEAAAGHIAPLWTALEDLVFDGTLAGVSIGVSNYRPQDIEAVVAVARIIPAVNQFEFHPYLLAHTEGLIALQKKHGIATEAYGPLTPLLRHPTGGPLKPVLERIAKTHNIDPATVLLLWVIAKGHVAISGSAKADNLKKLAAIDQLPDLTAEEVAEIDAVGRKIHFRGYKVHHVKDFPAPDLPEDLPAEGKL
ncbi:NAD/NADP-dependent indole-3-acetaldehyde reductase [Vanrija pseudolonga]|uniref:NAD/NADP-dependent indole-3-acetaldehyde reductase n=1 Tax=Vanrija pseudolonga TaxID=143232 RepID=A0AAF0Y5V7_9TREE|nr:NAD/NADP-dependent indole-3-acetaldehyde reductase [Vanrija pseudolonga]